MHPWRYSLHLSDKPDCLDKFQSLHQAYCYCCRAIETSCRANNGTTHLYINFNILSEKLTINHLIFYLCLAFCKVKFILFNLEGFNCLVKNINFLLFICKTDELSHYLPSLLLSL